MEPSSRRPGADETRLWGGTTLADRRSERRTKLLAAGLDLLGGGDGAPVSVRAVCRGAQLTERYFYESFTDRDALVRAVYDDVAARAHAVLVEATRSVADRGDRMAVARAAVEAMVEHVLDDPRRGRVLLVAPITEPQLAGRGMEIVPGIVELVREHLSPEASAAERAMIATGLTGALMGLFHAFLAGGLQVDRAQFVEHCVWLLVTVDRLER